MSFHSTNFGSFGRGLSRYIDRQGYLPESAEDLLSMDYELDSTDLNPETGEWDEDLRQSFWEEAKSAIDEAQEALSNWQSSQ